MKRSDWFFIILPLFFVWAVDHFTKLWGQSLTTPIDYGFIGFRLYHNHGAFLGFFSDLPPLLRIVSLSTIGSFLVFSYAITQYLLPIKSVALRLGMSILLGGIIGNVTDRILWGYVVDFIILDVPGINFHPLNLADVFQWVGYFFVAYALIKEDELLWPERNNRKRLWINPNYQYRYIFLLLLVALSLTLIGCVFSYTYLKVTIFELIGENKFIPKRFLIPYIFTYFTISSIFCGFLVIIGRRISHRNAGPIYAFTKYIEDLLEGRNRKFKLRSADEFKQLEALGQKVLVFLQEHQLIDDDDFEKVLTSVSHSSEDLSVGAIPVPEQIPDYKKTKTNQFIRESLIENQQQGVTPKFRDCPLCGTSSLQSIPSPVADYLVQCQHCHFTFDPRKETRPEQPSSSPRSAPVSLKEDSLPFLSGRMKELKKTLEKISQHNPTYKTILYYGPSPAEFYYACEGLPFEKIDIVGFQFSGSASLPEDPRIRIFSGSLQSEVPRLLNYDFILLDEAVEREALPEKLMDLATSILLPGSTLLIRTPDINSSIAKKKKSQWLPLWEGDRVSFFERETLSQLIVKKGLEVQSIQNSSSYYSLADLRVAENPLKDFWMKKLLFFIPAKWSQKFLFRINAGFFELTAQPRPHDTNA